MRVYRYSAATTRLSWKTSHFNQATASCVFRSVELYWASGWLVRSCLRVCYHTNVMFSCSSLWETAGRPPAEKRIEKEREVA